MRRELFKTFIIAVIGIFYSADTLAACGGTTRTWTGTNVTYSTASNWDTNDVPDTASEDAVIVNTGNNARLRSTITVGCVDVQSGTLLMDRANTLTVTGDYFRAPNSGGLDMSNANMVIDMAGTSAQTFNVVDEVTDLTISNNSSVSLTNDFTISSEFVMTGSGTTNIEGNVIYDTTTSALVIPAGHTLVIKNGGSLYAKGGITVNGTLRIEAGSQLQIYRSKVLSVASGGVIQLNGASSNPVRIISESTSRVFVFNMAGTMSASNFLIQRAATQGINVTGSISAMDNGEFRGIAGGGFGLTLGASASVPSTMDSIGFYNDDGNGGVGNVDATNYNNGIVTFTNYTGDIGGATYETDPNVQIDWSAPAATELAITNPVETNEPAADLDPGDEFTFAEFSFTLTQADTTTDITEVIVTMSGSGSTSDLEYVRAYIDQTGNKNCDFEANKDVQVGGDLVFSGTPPQATVTLAAGALQTSGPSDQGCLHIRAKAAANPVDQKTIQFSVSSTSDVTNSQGYSFSTTSGPPLNAGYSTIRNPNYSSWNGSTSTSISDANNWSGGLPSSTRNCQVGVGTNIALFDANPLSCAAATLQTGGEIDWNNTSNALDVYGSFTIQSGFTLTNATSAVANFKGTADQDLSFVTSFPGSVVINNSAIVYVTSSSTIGGNLTCTAGKISVASGVNLSVTGNVTVQTGCELEIQAGGTLTLGNGSVLTVDSGGTLTAVGTSGSPVTITSAGGYTAVINGTISAQYYAFNHIGTAGFSIESGATIDATNHLQNGSFTYPSASNSTLLYLKTQVPTNTLDNMVFSTNGSAATNVMNIDTTGAAAGTLSITGFSGDLAGSSFDVDPSYNIAWSGETNTIDVAVVSQATTPVTVGNIYTMGVFSFTQSSAGASFNDANITSLKITLDGTGTSADIDGVTLYYDSNCDGTGGTQIGTGNFSGSPATVTFSLTAGQLVVPADVSSPATICAYVDFTISSSGVDGNTVGFNIEAATDIVNDQSYEVSPSTTIPIDLGTGTIDAPSTTIWTGATSTDWFTAGNWSAGVPNSTKSCEISNVTNHPTIASGTAECQNLNITNGILTLSGGANLDIYGNFSSAGTFNQTGNLFFKDGGVATNHAITTNATIANLNISKTSSGEITLTSGTVQIDTLTITSGNFNIKLGSGRTLILPSGVSLSTGAIEVQSGGNLQIGNGQSLLVNGGTLTISGTNDIFTETETAAGPPAEYRYTQGTSKGKISVVGDTGSWTFSATSGTVNFLGFHLDRLDTNGVNISGTTSVTNFSGGQLTNLSASYASMKGIQLNTTGTLPISMQNIAWNWGDFNSIYSAVPNANTPATTDSYTIISSTGCNSQTVDISGWTGDWYETSGTGFDATTKVSSSGCTINLGDPTSSVSLLSFEAIGYDNAIDVRWETNIENNHMGFNVYRANESGSEFQQINTELVRNYKQSGSRQGKYRFIDNDVNNGETYYYYIEDVEYSGTRTLHGPVNATADATAGTPPADGADDNSGSNPNDGDDGNGSDPSTIANPSYRDLGNGVEIYNQTSSSLRIIISPDSPVFSASSWNAAYEDVAITGYSKVTTEGHPELLERVLLIEVYPYATSAVLSNTEVTDSTLAGHNITPAPSYSLDGNGVLVPSYAEDTTAYANNNLAPSSYVTVSEALESKGDKKYLRIKINPLKYNPVTDDIKYASKVILDIGLDGDAWDVTPPNSGSVINPFLVANSLRIDYQNEGMHQLNFDSLVNSSVEGPFDGVDVDSLRLYIKGKEVPLEVYSPTGYFSSGDYIRFYAPYEKSIESKRNSAVLSTVEISESSSSVKRISDFDGDPTPYEQSSFKGGIFKKTFEVNDEFINGQPLGHSGDHYFWYLMRNGSGWNQFDEDLAIPEIDPSSGKTVLVHFYVQGAEGPYEYYVDHHVSLSVNGNESTDIIFKEQTPKKLTFEVPAFYFVSGANNFLFELKGTFAPDQWGEILLVDKVEVEYYGYKAVTSGFTNFYSQDTGVTQSLFGFTNNNIHIYDISDPYNALKISNALITTPDSGASYDVEFYANETLGSHDMKRFEAVQTGSFVSVTGLSLIPGFGSALKDTSNSADYLVIGHPTLIEAFEEISSRRESQGLTVRRVETEQIYGEFNNGTPSSAAIREFLNFTQNSWSGKPRYVVLLGDSTDDPLNHDLDGLGNTNNAAIESETLAMPHLGGRFVDFGSDNFYVTAEGEQVPFMSIGRIPTNNPEDIINYAQKVIDFEDGVATPSLENQITFFAGKQTNDYGDNFKARNDKYANLLTTLTATVVDSAYVGHGTNFKNEIMSTFSNPPLFMSLMGHGAYDKFDDANALNVTDMPSLSNSKYPVVMMWNCETALYYYNDQSSVSLGEALIFKENAGAVAFLGSTAMTTPTAQDRLAQSLLNTLNADLLSYYKGQRLGDILTRAKSSLGSGVYEKDIMNSFVLIGDPTIKLPESLYQPQPGEPKKEIKGGGCTMSMASDGSKIPWHQGFLEWLLIAFIFMAPKAFRRLIDATKS